MVSDANIGATVDNSPLTVQDGYALLSARLALLGPDDHWSVSVFGDNLTNTHYCADKVYNVLEGPLGLRFPGGTAVRCVQGVPRRIGVSAGLRF